MPAPILLSHTRSAADLAVSPQDGLRFHVSADGGLVLYATTRHDGAMTAWRLLDDGRMTRISSVAYQHGAGGGGTGGQTGMAIVPLAGGGEALLAGGGKAGGLMLVAIGADGALGRATALGALSSLAGDMVAPQVTQLGNGVPMIHAGIVGSGGLARFIIAADGRRGAVQITHDNAETHAGAVTALASLALGGRDILVSVSRSDLGMTAWEVGTGGGLTALASLAPAQGLWISEPTALAATTIGGRGYLVLGAAGSSSLSVVEIGADGAMAPRAHLLDDRDSRFGGVTALAVVEHQGLTYVVAGGADDGISLFLLLPGGMLVAEAHLADSPAMGLANISAIAAASTARGLEIIVASGAEAGLTRLRHDPGPRGQTLTAGPAAATLTGTAGRDLIQGGAGDDALFGGAGADIIRDGAGSDRMTGGAGADLFVLARDGRPDVVADFDPAEDRLNLTAWPGLRSLEQLRMTQLSNGLRIIYGDEELTLLSADGRPIAPGRLNAADHIGGALIPPETETGHPAPDKPPPPLPPPIAPRPPVRGGAGGDRLAGTAGIDSILGLGGDDFLFGGAGADALDGGAGRDRLYGGDGDDALWGGPGGDSLWGGGGHDRIRGGPGADLVWGGAGQDRIWGGHGDDRLRGGAGGDTLWGGLGHDSLWGGAGDDILRGGGGRDSLWGGTGDDRLYGGPGDDLLRGGLGRDRLAGGAGNDRLRGGGGGDSLRGEAGADQLWGEAGADSIAGGSGHDRIWGGGGNDRLAGDGGNDQIWGGPGDDILSGGPGHDRLFGGLGRDRLAGGRGNDGLTGGAGADIFDYRRGGGHDRITDFGAGADRLLLDPGLWRGALTAAQVVARFAEASRGDVVFDFGSGQSLRLEDISSLAGLARLIDIG